MIKLTYAGNPENLADFKNDDRYSFIHGDICNKQIVEEIFEQYSPDYLVNFAAESHVDRSIGKPDYFIQTDIFGTFTLLEAARKFGLKKFIQISTDEVYGSIEKGQLYRERYPDAAKEHPILRVRLVLIAWLIHTLQHITSLQLSLVQVIIMGPINSLKN